MSIPIDGLAEAIAAELQDYQQEVVDDLKDSVHDAAKACLKEIKANSPADSGDYRKGWKLKTAYESGNDIRLQVYNKDHYQLTHLLEVKRAFVAGEDRIDNEIMHEALGSLDILDLQDDDHGEDLF
jgi:hypothetical protein